MLTKAVRADTLTDLSWAHHGTAVSDAEAEFVVATDHALAAGERWFDAPDDPEAGLAYEQAMGQERRAATHLAALRREVALRLPIRSQRA